MCFSAIFSHAKACSVSLQKREDWAFKKLTPFFLLAENLKIGLELGTWWSNPATGGS